MASSGLPRTPGAGVPPSPAAMERLRVLVSDLQAGLGLPANPHQASTGAIILARMTSAFGSVSVRSGP